MIHTLCHELPRTTVSVTRAVVVSRCTSLSVAQTLSASDAVPEENSSITALARALDLLWYAVATSNAAQFSCSWCRALGPAPGVPRASRR